MCRGCGADTRPRNGKGDAYAHCKACHPGAIRRIWTRQRVLHAMREWHVRYGRLPSSYDWSPTHARKLGGDALERLAKADWPAASVVTDLFGETKRNWTLIGPRRPRERSRRDAKSGKAAYLQAIIRIGETGFEPATARPPAGIRE